MPNQVNKFLRISCTQLVTYNVNLEIGTTISKERANEITGIILNTRSDIYGCPIGAIPELDQECNDDHVESQSSYMSLYYNLKEELS